MSFISVSGVLLTLVLSSTTFAGGGGGCGRIPRAVENKEVRCIGQVKSGLFSTKKFDTIFPYYDDLPYDQGSAEVINYLAYDGLRSDKNLGITFHCDDFKEGKLVGLGKQYIILGQSRVVINLGPNNRSVKDIMIRTNNAATVVSCYLSK